MTETPTAAWAAPAPAPVPPPGRRRHPVARGFGLVLGWLAAVLAGFGLLAHVLDTRHQSLVVLASGAWVFAPFAVVALGLALWRRAWVATAVAVALVALEVVVYAPLFVAQTAPTSPAATVTVLTQNLLYGEADAADVVARVRADRVDVFVAQELTPQEVTALRDAGLQRLLPHSALDPRPASAGTGIWSRYPLADVDKLAARGLAGVSGRVVVGGVTLGVVTVHPDAPFPQDPRDWYRELDMIRGLLLARPAGPVVVGGDFNASYDNARFRRLLVDGWRDGAEQAGSGVIRSWPADLAVPPVVGIDHVLTRGAVATSVTALHTPGSDHRGLLATVVVPR